MNWPARGRLSAMVTARLLNPPGAFGTQCPAPPAVQVLLPEPARKSGSGSRRLAREIAAVARELAKVALTADLAFDDASGLELTGTELTYSEPA